MKQRNLSEWVHVLANLGVIIGIGFLVIEMRQNNALMELEAQAILNENLQDGWSMISSDPVLVDLFIKDRNGQELSEAEEFRLNAYWMGMLLRREWQHKHFPQAETGVAGLRRLFGTYGSLRRAWNGSDSASRSAGKDNFSPEFVRFIENQVISRK
jgi:hypothetical protein